MYSKHQNFQKYWHVAKDCVALPTLTIDATKLCANISDVHRFALTVRVQFEAESHFRHERQNRETVSFASLLEDCSIAHAFLNQTHPCFESCWAAGLMEWNVLSIPPSQIHHSRGTQWWRSSKRCAFRGRHDARWWGRKELLWCIRFRTLTPTSLNHWVRSTRFDRFHSVWFEPIELKQCIIRFHKTVCIGTCT